MEAAIWRLAQRQYWVVARWQLLELGLGADAIDHRLGSGRLFRLHRGVYAYGRPDIPQRGRWLAAVLACGEGALLGYTSAGALRGIAGVGGRVTEVTSTRRPARSDPLIAHHTTRSLDTEDRDIVDGVPVTSLPRTLVDLATILSTHGLRDAFEEADRLNLLQLDSLRAACSRARGRRGIGTLRALIQEASVPDPTKGAFEMRFRHFCRDHALPAPKVNAQALSYTVDVLWREQRLIVELDSWEHHGKQRTAFESDRDRDAKLMVAGYRVLRLTWRRLGREPSVVAAELRALLTLARS